MSQSHTRAKPTAAAVRLAVLFTAVLLLAACSRSKESADPTTFDIDLTTATPTPVAQAQPVTPSSRSVRLNALYASESAEGEMTGGRSQLTVSVAAKTEPGVRVSFSEAEVGGQGASMRAAGWTAATTAALLLGVDPGRLAFSYEIGGRADGPSAGALMTVGTLAAILGDQIPADLAMTGTINPDGSVGAVSGIPHKLDGAARAGMKTVLIPAGQRTDYDANQGRSVDLIRRGEELGLQVRPVANVWEAYQAATGASLPQPRGAARPATPARLHDRMQAATSAWLARYADARSRFASYSPEVQDAFAGGIARADAWAEQARKSAAEGSAAVALERASNAAYTAMSANQGASIIQTYIDRGLVPALAQAEAAMSVRTAAAAQLERLKAERPATASDVVGLLDAYSNYVVAEVMVSKGDAQVANLRRRGGAMDEEEIVEALIKLTDAYVSAELYVQFSRTNLDMYLGMGTAPVPSLETLAGLAEMLRRAAEANLAAFDAIVVTSAAEEADVRDETVRLGLARLDPGYDLLLRTVGLLTAETDRQGPPQLSQVLYTLGGGLNAYGLSTAALSKYYSLDAELDDDFRVVGFGRESALTAMLQLADRRAEDLLGLPKDVAPPAIFYLENARAYRNGDDSQKLDALFYGWQSAVLSQLLANMTGEYGESVRSELKAANRNADFQGAGSWRP
jgi:uncharacterized protein